MSTALALPALLARHAEERPAELALVAGGRGITFAELDRLCRQAAAWLETRGIGPGDRVAVWLVNRVEWLALLFGLARVGACLVAVNTRYRAAELQHILSASGARLLVLQPRFRNIDFVDMLRGVDTAALPALERVALVGDGAGAPDTLLHRPVVTFDAFDGGVPAVADRSESAALAMLFTTSGTTKLPKLVKHSQGTLSFHSRMVAGGYGFEEPGTRLLASLPLCGVFGLNPVLAALTAGAPTVLMEAFDAVGAAELVQLHGITHAFGSDQMYRRMLAAVPGDHPFPSARVFGYAAFHSGAAGFAREAWARGVPVYGLYGSSEVQALFSLQPADAPLDRRIEGGGRPAAGERAVVRIRDVDSGGLLPPGFSGEIEIRSPGNFTGYLDAPEATAAAVDAEGFFRTDDIGHLREDGTFVYETRKGDAIRLAGFLVNPAEIEDVLKGFPEVDDAQVIGVEIAGEPRCVAFVIPAPEAAVGEEELIGRAADLMARFKVPARIWMVDEYPATESANGTKIQRGRLRQMAMERLAG